MPADPKPNETLTAKRDRWSIEAKAAWAEHEASERAVNANMARLRQARLAREAAEALSAAEPKVPVKRAAGRKKVIAKAAE